MTCCSAKARPAYISPNPVASRAGYLLTAKQLADVQDRKYKNQQSLSLRPFTGFKPTLNAQKIYMRRAQFQRLMAVHQGRGYSRCGSRNRRTATCSRPNIERGWHLGTIAVLPHPISAPARQSRRREHPDDTALARRQRVGNDVVAFFCAQ